MKKNQFLFLVVIALFISSCNTTPKATETVTQPDTSLSYAKGFHIEKKENITLITVTSPWPEAQQPYVYALVPKGSNIQKDTYNAVIEVPVTTTMATSTTHIPALEALNATETLVAFPDTQYISSERTRQRIESGKITDVGMNENINTELLLDIAPEVIFGFSINGQNKAYQTLERSGIPVVYNGDWTEQTPLGKAEWIKFFAPFFGKEKEADSIFKTIEKSYNSAKDLATQTAEQPTVLSGAMFKDVWYLPGGQSWMAQFITDANGAYLWATNEDTGSLALSFENVYDKAQQADIWLGPGQFTSYEQMSSTNSAYTDFEAYQKHKVYTYSNTKGSTGGLLYYELAPNRPDIVLKDIIHILHPEITPEYEPFFFKPLE
ncbi:ABC transporter substrate-binding protein [Pustulibacterium marinum]|nr:ABC transporter substrate-binding protein [Pustulibacterium marinum]